jgi:hypothetical protein
MRLIILLTVLFLTSCKPGDKGDKKSDSQVNTALTFINDYVDNCNKMKEAINVVDWVNSNQLTTNRFKAELKKTDEDAWKREPNVGLDSDPLYGHQYYPDKGFELDSFDEQTNYLTVKGKNMPDFKVTMRVVKENEKWLVDGCGLIGIPENKRVSK